MWRSDDKRTDGFCSNESRPDWSKASERISLSIIRILNDWLKFKLKLLNLNR